MHFIIFDVEATCWENPMVTKHKQQEIIEIGAVKVNEAGEIIDTFSAFVRPIFEPILTDFCKTLTNISQEDVAQAETFDMVAPKFKAWVEGNHQVPYAYGSWGFFDQRILSKNCIYHQLDDAWTKPHISLKHQYPRLRRLSRTFGLQKALEYEDMTFQGNHHRALDDAKNTARIFILLQAFWNFQS